MPYNQRRISVLTEPENIPRNVLVEPHFANFNFDSAEPSNPGARSKSLLAELRVLREH